MLGKPVKIVSYQLVHCLSCQNTVIISTRSSCYSLIILWNENSYLIYKVLLPFIGVGILVGLDHQRLDSNSPSNLMLYTTLIHIEIFIKILLLY